MPRNITVHFPNGTTHTYQGVPDRVTVGQMRAQIAKDFPGQQMAPLKPTSKPAPLPQTSVGGALWRGVEDGVPFKNYLQAGANVLGSKLGLNNTPSSMSYLDRVRALKASGDNLEEADRQQHPIAHYVGEGGGLVIGGGGVGAGVKTLATRVAPKAAAAVANVLQRSLAARVAGSSVAGAAGGATYAAGDANPEDAGTEALKGAAGGAVVGVAAPAVARYVAKPLAGLGARAVQWLSTPFTNAMKSANASRVLGNITSASTDDLARAADDFRAHNSGAEPTLFQLLPLVDRNKIINKVVAGRDNLIEQSQRAIDTHTTKVGSQMASHIDTVLQPHREAIEHGLLNDMRTARGGQLEPGDVGLVGRAMSNTTDMDALKKLEADAYMAPHKDTQVAENFSDILPQAPKQKGKTVQMVETDPAVSTMLRSLTPAGYRASGQGVSVGDIAGDLIPSLNDIRAKGGMDGAIAGRAIEHLQGVLADTSPDVAAAQQAMNDAYAARSRMIEGMNAGKKIQLRDDQSTGPGGGNAQLVRNQYDTPEGQAGLLLGTHNRLTSDLASSPKQAASTIAALADNSIGRQLENNVGTDAAGQIVAGAKDQHQGLQALRVASGQMGSGGADDTGAGLATIGQAATIAHPYFSPATKIKAATKLAASFNIPENRARTILDMAFSGDPTMQQRAIAALGPKGPAYLQSLAGTAVAAGQVGAGEAADGPQQPAAPQQPQLPDMPQIEAGEAPAAAPGAEPGMPEMPQIDGAPTDGGQPAADPAQSPYAQILDHYRATENPDVVALGQRMWGQESGHRQFGRDGKPLTSKKGAIGVAQVEPGTAPEAAAFAGLPWDPHAYQYDPAYNELLGYAYLSKQLLHHNGDPTKAAASYNAGPTRTDMSLRTGAPLPAETRDYVARVAS